MMLKVKGDRLYYRSALQRSKHDCLTAHQGIYSATPTMWPREAVTRCQQQTWDLAVLLHVDTQQPTLLQPHTPQANTTPSQA